MWKQIAAIAWAQFRISRNHLPRVGLGTVLTWFALLFWYGLYTALAIVLASKIPQAAISDLSKWLPVGLLAIFLFWQVVPLFTLSSGWSLDLSKLRVYPLSESALLGIEILLRVTTAPEMLIVLAGLMAGLLRHPGIPALAPFAVLAFIPLNLFVQLGVRDLILYSFERNRFRELFAVVLIAVAVLPQLLLRTGMGPSLKPYLMTAAHSPLAPWFDVASLSLGRVAVLDIAFLLLWTAISFGFALSMFLRSLSAEDDHSAAGVENSGHDAGGFTPAASVAKVFRDPLAALFRRNFNR